MTINQFHSSDKDEIISQIYAVDIRNLSLVMIYADKSFLLDDDIKEIIKLRFSKTCLIGCSTAGEIYQNRFYEGSFALSAIYFKHTEVRKESIRIRGNDDSFIVGQQLISKLNSSTLSHVFVLSDGIALNGSELVDGINSVIPKGVGVSGGLAGDGDLFSSTLVSNGSNDFKEHIVTAIGFYGTKIKVNCASFGGWESFGISRIVTKSIGNEVFEIDGIPALELYKIYLKDKAADLPASALLFPLSMQSTFESEVLVRTILAVNHEKNSLTFAGNIPEGAKVKLMKANVDSLINGAEMAAKHAKFYEEDESSNGLAIMISCVGRKSVLHQLVNEEVEVVVDTFGSHYAYTGFYSYGEISTDKLYETCSLHNQTMTITNIIELN